MSRIRLLIWRGIIFGQQIYRSWTSLSWKKPILAKWNARLEEEELLTFSKVAAKDASKDGHDGEVSSKAASKSGTSLAAEIDALVEEGPEIQAQTVADQAEATSNAEDNPPPSQT